MVSLERSDVGAVVENLFQTREYQGSSYGHKPFSRGDPEGYLRRIEVGSGVFSAADNRFNAYLRNQFAADVLSLYTGAVPEITPAAYANDDTTGHSKKTQEFVGNARTEIEYWSNAHRTGTVPNDRMYSVTIRLEAMSEDVAALQKRVEMYSTQLQQAFGLRSTNSQEQRKEAA